MNFKSLKDNSVSLADFLWKIIIESFMISALSLLLKLMKQSGPTQIK